MTTAIPDGQPVHPKLSAEEASLRILKLIGNLKSNQDLNPKNIAKHTGLPMQHTEDQSGRFGCSGEITAQWGFELYVIPHPDGGPRRRLTFDFSRTGSKTASITPVCILDLDYYALALQEMGFESHAARDVHERIIYWWFHRPDLTVKLYVEDKDGETPGACVQMILVQ